MSTTTPFSVFSERIKADPARRARVEARNRAVNRALDLAELRAQRDLTQHEVAATLGESQANLSRVERGRDPYLSTLHDDVAALGGRLEINAVFPDGIYSLSDGKSMATP